MREILFRGKRIDNGEWIVGHLLTFEDGRARIIESQTDIFCYEKDNSIIQTVAHEVYPETVGQFTGLLDKNGKKIFEGDIVDCWSEGVNAQGEVQQRKDGLWIIYPAWQKTIMWGLCPDEYCHTTVEVIGNIHDNPEMVEDSR